MDDKGNEDEVRDPLRGASAEGDSEEGAWVRPARASSYFTARVLNRVVDEITAYVWSEKRSEGPVPSRLGWRSIQILWSAIARFSEHDCMLRASALTYSTFLSSVPLLALIFSLSRGWLSDKIQDTILDRLTAGTETLSIMPSTSSDGGAGYEDYVTIRGEDGNGPAVAHAGPVGPFPPAGGAESDIEAAMSGTSLAEIQSRESQDEAVHQIREFTQNTLNVIENTQMAGLTGIGIVTLFFVAISLLRNVEQSMNVVWGVKRGRTFVRAAADFIGLIIFAPALLALGVSASTAVRVPSMIPFSDIFNEIFLATVIRVLPFVTIWTAFFLIYFAMANTRVYWVSALLGGVIGGTMWQLAQTAYVHYSIMFFAQRYNVIYGAFAWVLVLMVWVYISWGILLFGAEISAAHQTLDDHRRLKRPWNASPAELETVVLRAVSILARPMNAPLGTEVEPLTFDKLTDMLRTHPEPVRKVLKLLQDSGLVRQDFSTKGYFLSRSTEDITVMDVLRLARYGNFKGECPVTTEGESPLSEAGRRMRESLAGLQLKDLARMDIERIYTFDLEPAAQASAAEPVPRIIGHGGQVSFRSAGEDHT